MYWMEKVFPLPSVPMTNMQANMILNYALKQMLFYCQNHVDNIIIKYMSYLLQNK